MNIKRIAAITSLVTLSQASAVTAQDYDNTWWQPTWNTQAYETTAANGNIIQSTQTNQVLFDFSYWLSLGQAGVPTTIRARIVEVTPAPEVGRPNLLSISGPIWSSRLLTPSLPGFGVGGGTLDAAYQRVDFMAAVRLDPDKFYATFIDVIEGSIGLATGNVPAELQDPALDVTDGFILADNGETSARHGSAPVFRANYTPVPEPDAWLLLLTGLLGLASVYLGRRTAPTPI